MISPSTSSLRLIFSYLNPYPVGIVSLNLYPEHNIYTITVYSIAARAALGGGVEEDVFDRLPM